MKRLFLLIALFGVLAVGCENLLPNEQSPNSNAIFVTDSNDAYIIEVAGGELVVTITTNVDYSIVIPEEAKSWLSVADTRAEARMEKQTFIIAENDTFETRLANVEFVDGDGKVLKTILFSQKCDDKVFTTDAEGNYIVIAEGGEVNVAVTTNLEYSVAIPEESQKWLSVADTRAEIREETLTFIVAENETFEERSVSVELLDNAGMVLQTMTFVQRGQAKVFETDGKNSYAVDAVGGKVNIVVTTNLEYNINVAEDAQEWLSVVDTRAVVREETLTFIVARNEAYDRRSTTVEFIDNEGNVLQTIEFVQRAALMLQFTCPSNEIWYTNGETTEPTMPNVTNVFGANIVSNEYDIEKECWVIKFDGDVTSIGERAFAWCESLTSVTIPDSVTTIGYDAFCCCTSLICVTIPDSVTAIGEQAFVSCRSLTSVTIGNGVTRIGKGAFGNCISLTSVTIPDSVTTIGDYAFFYCISLTEFNGKYASEDGRCLIIDGTINSFAPAGLTEYTIPDSVTSIGERAFASCASLTSITIPDSVTTIEANAFAWCPSLTSVTIPDSVTTIGEMAFYDCSSLTSVTIPDGVTSIGSSAFAYCSSLTSVTIPDSVTTIGEQAFCLCSSLTSVTIPDSVTLIEFSAFLGCSSLTSVTIGDSVTTIGDCAFYGCSSLTSITIPGGVITIRSWAFGDCSSLTSVYCKATTPPAGGNDMFSYDVGGYNKPIGCTIYVPMKSVNKYKSASGWSEYADDIVGYNF